MPPPDGKKPTSPVPAGPPSVSGVGGRLPPPSPAGSGPPTLGRAPAAAPPAPAVPPSRPPAQTAAPAAQGPARPAAASAAGLKPPVAPSTPQQPPRPPAPAAAKPPAPPPQARPPAPPGARTAIAPPPPPATPAKKKKAARTLDDLDPNFISVVADLWNKLDTSDYFEVLRLEKSATPPDIKKAYHRDSREFHPDRHFKLEDVEFRDRITDIYKRVNEAYVTLRDDRKRTMYLQDVTGAERTTRMRWVERTEAEIKAVARKEIEEQVGNTPQGRKFYETAMKEFNAKKFAAAERNFKMALTFEPNNAKYKEMLKEAGKNIKMDFTIK